MNFDQLSKPTAFVDAVGSVIIGCLVVFAWLTVDKPIQYIYTPLVENAPEVIIVDDDNSSSNASPPAMEGQNNTTTIERRHEGLEGCVITWCLTLLLVICAWRIISSAILVLAAQKRSLSFLQYWMGYKGLVLMLSTFILVPALTATIIIPSAAASFILDLVTSYFVRFLVPEMESISKGSARKSGNKVVL